MELEDLKATWKQSGYDTGKKINVMELIQNKSYGPVAAMKTAFAKEIGMMAIIPVILVLTNLDNIGGVLRSLMFWSYVIFCAGVIVFASRNFRLLGRMDGRVKSHLVQQLYLLETRLKRNLAGIRVAMIYFILLTEIMPYFQHYRTLDFWLSVPPLVRFGTYVSLLVLQYFVSRRVAKKKYGEHIAYLKELVKEME